MCLGYKSQLQSGKLSAVAHFAFMEDIEPLQICRIMIAIPSEDGAHLMSK
jgi:hypothetical protein